MAETAAHLAALDARLQVAAKAGDAVALARDYRCAADHAARDGNEDAAGFYLTHAYVWALVAGDAAGAASLARDLRRQGRLD